jgi:hypothetical protein
MEDFALINASQMHRVFNKLSTVEFKMLLMIVFYLSSNNKELLIHNAEFREFLSSVGFAKTSIRISTILSSMVKKGVLVREGQGVFSVPGNLFSPANTCKE